MQNRVNMLNQEFNSLSFLFNSGIKLLNNSNDKQNAYTWANKLRRSTSDNLQGYKMRNLVLSTLIKQLYNRELSAPFNTHPTFPTLEDLNQFFPNMNLNANILEMPVPMPEDLRLPKIMERSPDHGAFLLTQPVPKCGAFCYLAVVSRPPK